MSVRGSKYILELITALCLLQISSTEAAAAGGSLSGSVDDADGVAVSAARIEILSSQGNVIQKTTASSTGEFQILQLAIGDYQVKTDVPGFNPFRTVARIVSDGDTRIEIHLTAAKEMIINVKAKKQLIPSSGSFSRTQISKEQISQLPQGSEVSLPRLLTTTSPGVVAGAFNQMFFRGNHANIQYQIDGVQLPDSPSGTFGEAFSPRNIDHMEIITGGIPAEYGERLAAVANIVTKSGQETPGGEVELNYGSYDTFSPHLLYGGSTESGALHYFVSANYHQTSRGLDTPQPKNSSEQTQGGTDAVHDKANGNSEFAKIDWLVDNTNKISFVLFNSENHFQIPNYPSSFSQNDPLFSPNFSDHWGNVGGFIYTPPFTNDYQDEANAYIETIWKHTFDNQSFLQIAPYYKYSFIHFQNDPGNDLFSCSSLPCPAASFYENRNTGNYGLKADYTIRPSEKHHVKVGSQIQYARSEGTISVQTYQSQPSFDSNPNTSYFESFYVQDDYSIDKRWILNAGLRFDATQFSFADSQTSDSLLQPRVGLNYLMTDTTKLHVFYGKLFQPAPAEDLRDTFSNIPGAGQLTSYDIKAEKDDYYEIGIAQQFLERQAALLNFYYKDATNMLDDTQLLNTAIAQPYNFAKGYAYGLELSVKGEISDHWTEYLNYSYEIAKGYGISGGIFAFPSGQQPQNNWKFLDHVQVQTANAGVTYREDRFWWTTQGLYGSGLRTDPNNGTSLPAHFTFDTTIGYEFRGDAWYSRFKISGDILNIFDNVYPITIANGFNGSHYAAGRQFFVRVSKEL